MRTDLSFIQFRAFSLYNMRTRASGKTYHHRHLSEERTTELLRAVKKTDSRVDGDPLAHLVRCHPEAFAAPISTICNRINDSGHWPLQWKTEHLTIIPKNPNPSDLSECRNISCTSIFSKVLEGVVLLKLRGELAPDPTKYGGAPKCGAEHMLVDIWEKVLVALEGGKIAAVLLGVDYKKAFNRMDHAVCIKQLQKLGASPGSISMVRAFLERRQMTITIDGIQAKPVNIVRGRPQGSVLGCLRYCLTTQQFTVGLRQPERTQYFPQSDSDDSFDPVWVEEGGSFTSMTPHSLTPRNLLRPRGTSPRAGGWSILKNWMWGSTLQTCPRELRIKG